MDTLAADIRNAPFSFTSVEEAEELVAILPVAPKIVANALDQDARVHEQADNWIKAGVIRDLAKRVRATAR